MLLDKHFEFQSMPEAVGTAKKFKHELEKILNAWEDLGSEKAFVVEGGLIGDEVQVGKLR